MSALVLARLSPSLLIRGDAFSRFLDQGAVAPWLPEATEQNRVVIRASGAAAGRFVSGYEAVYDAALGPWWLPTFFKPTELDDLHYAILLPAERCVHNVGAREGHVDEPAARHMHDQFQRALTDLDAPPWRGISAVASKVGVIDPPQHYAVPIPSTRQARR